MDTLVVWKKHLSSTRIEWKDSHKTWEETLTLWTTDTNSPPRNLSHRDDGLWGICQTLRFEIDFGEPGSAAIHDLRSFPLWTVRKLPCAFLPAPWKFPPLNSRQDHNLLSILSSNCFILNWFISKIKDNPDIFNWMLSSPASYDEDWTIPLTFSFHLHAQGCLSVGFHLEATAD